MSNIDDIRPRDGEARVIQALEDAGAGAGLTVPEMAERTGLHVNAVRRNLARLAEGGRVHIDRAAPPGAGRGRPPLRYRAVASDAMAYRELMPLVLALLTGEGGAGVDAAADAYRTGREYGLANAPAGDPREAVTASLAALGFAPQADPGPPGAAARLALTRCPFSDTITHPGGRALCALHHGILAGVAEARGGELVRFDVVDPRTGHCQASVADAAPLDGQAAPASRAAARNASPRSS
jgi:predicted ArsR family transcriptional regulator